MTTHFLTVAIRNLMKYKTQTLVSVIGLAIGLAASSLAGMWLKYNSTYDAHWPEAERTYCVLGKYNHYSQIMESTPNPLAEYIKEHLPEAETTCRLTTVSSIDYNNGFIPITGVDSCALRMFPIHIIDGNPDFHLQPKQFAISESTARKLYGTTNVIGMELKSGDEALGIITTLFEDIEGHSNFYWDILTASKPIETKSFTDSDGKVHHISPWNQSSSNTFIRLHKGTDVKKAMEKLENALKKDNLLKDHSYSSLLLTDFKNREGQYYTIQLEHIRIFCLMGGLIVLAAILNYLILYAIRIRMRVREMTLRKVHGASKLNLTALLMTELAVLLICTYPIGMAIVELTLPAFRQLSGIQESSGYFYGEGTLFMLFTMGASLLLSLIVIHMQCRKTLQAGLRKDNLLIMRKVCLGIQLVISIGFIFCASVMYKQIHYLHQSPETGFKNTNVGFVSNLIVGVGPAEYEELYRHMKQIPYIDAHAIYGMPFNAGGRFPINDWEGKTADTPEITFGNGAIDKDIFEHFGLQLLAGSIPDDKESHIHILNESAIKALGWQLEEAIGKKVMGYPVTGVIKDIRLSPVEPVTPTHYMKPWQRKDIASIVFTYEGDFKEVKKKLEEYFKKACPHIHFSADTPAQWIENKLTSERALLKLLVVASTVSVLISIFGIFSLVNLSCERRRKEMALRKIHGAKVKDIAHLFAKEYAIVLAISAIVAFPIGYAIMKEWMMNYVMQTDIPAWMYIGILLLVSVLITLCVGYRVWRAANENPADVVKSE